MSFSEWKKYKLGDLVTFQRGHDLSKSEFIVGNVPIAGSNGIIGYHNKFTCKAPCITIGRSGNLGTPHFYNENIWAHNTTLFVKEFHKSDPKFIYYLLLTLDLKQFNSGSAVPSLNRNYIHPIEVLAPEIKTQQRISSILSSLDDKIELNRQTNKTLETIAQTLFKEMCLPKGEELTEGWRVKKLEDLIDTISVTHKMKQEKIIFLNTSDILEGNVLNSGYSVVATLPGQAKKSIKRNDILFSEIRPANKRFAFVNFDADDYVVSTKLMVLRSKGDISPYLIYCFLTNNDTLNQLQHLAETRSGTFPQITFNQLKDFQLVIPDNNKLKELSENIQSIYEMIFSNSKENQTLTTLRDSLLPKLMKGEIEV